MNYGAINIDKETMGEHLFLPVQEFQFKPLFDYIELVKLLLNFQKTFLL
jgi:hypothetical protein